MSELSNYYKKREEMQQIYAWLESHSLLAVTNKEEYNKIWNVRMQKHRRLAQLLHET